MLIKYYENNEINNTNVTIFIFNMWIGQDESVGASAPAAAEVNDLNAGVNDPISTVSTSSENEVTYKYYM